MLGAGSIQVPIRKPFFFNRCPQNNTVRTMTIPSVRGLCSGSFYYSHQNLVPYGFGKRSVETRDLLLRMRALAEARRDSRFALQFRLAYKYELDTSGPFKMRTAAGLPLQKLIVRFAVVETCILWGCTTPFFARLLVVELLA
jgi:hypothetical protein